MDNTAEETEWLNINLWEPDGGVDIIVKTPWGIRSAMRSVQFLGPMYVFTDCTHPMQNTNLSKYDIQGWRFAHAKDAENLRLTQNHWQLQRGGEEILSSVKYQVTIPPMPKFVHLKANLFILIYKIKKLFK